MRTVIFGGANSLDNYFARPDGGVDWLLWNDEAAAVTKETWKTVDTMIMGRKTYEVGAQDGAAAAIVEEELGPSVKSYVFSRTLPDEPGVTIVREDVVAFVRRLKGEPGKTSSIMGGGELARPLFEADLIDRVGFNIHPVLLGAGVPVFHPMTRQIHLELEDCRPISNGCVYVRLSGRYTDRQSRWGSETGSEKLAASF